MLLRKLAAITMLLVSAAAFAAPPTVLVEQTYLRSQPGQRAALIKFIKTNWFAMDQAGVSQGLFTSYALYEDIDANTDWDIVVAVGYPQPEGYDDPEAKAGFDAIRAKHSTVLVDGKDLAALGKIVRHHRLKIVD